MKKILSLAVLLVLGGCDPSDEPDMIWWTVEDLQRSGFVDALNAAPEGARLEYRYGSDLLHIVPAGVPIGVLSDDSTGGFNFSHTCPPDCP